MEHKKNWDLEIPQSNPPGLVSIYIGWGEEDRKEGSQIGGCYYETIEQEGGEIFTTSNCIRFFPLYCEMMWNCRVEVQTICLCVTVEQKGGRNSNGLFPIPHDVILTQYLLSNPVSRKTPNASLFFFFLPNRLEHFIFLTPFFFFLPKLLEHFFLKISFSFKLNWKGPWTLPPFFFLSSKSAWTFYIFNFFFL